MLRILLSNAEPISDAFTDRAVRITRDEVEDFKLAIQAVQNFLKGLQP